MYAPVRFDRFAIELGVRRQQGSSIIVHSGLTSTSDLHKCTQQIPKAPFEIFRGGQYPYRLLKIEADDVCVFRVFRVRGGIDPWAAGDTQHDLKLWFACEVIGWIDFIFWYLSSLASSDFFIVSINPPPTTTQTPAKNKNERTTTKHGGELERSGSQ